MPPHCDSTQRSLWLARRWSCTPALNAFNPRPCFQLRCRKDDGPFFECSLAWDESLRCEFVPALDGHIHGPRCGHEMVNLSFSLVAHQMAFQIPHGNHLDYLVGSRLHHVVGVPQMCCENRCLGEVVKSTVVDHGQVYIKQRGGCSKSEDENRARINFNETFHFVSGTPS